MLWWMDGMSRGDCLFLFLSILVPIHRRRESLGFPIIIAITANWMLRFSWKVLDSQRISRWNSMAFIFTQGQTWRLQEISHLTIFLLHQVYIFSWVSVTYTRHHWPIQQQELELGWQVHFWISSEFYMKIRLKYSRKVQWPKVDLNAWPWLSYSSNSGSQSMVKHDHLRPPLKASET